MSLSGRQIVTRATHTLQLRKRNPRTHNRKQIRKIAASIQKFGFVTPVLVDKSLTIIAGHGRLLAARELNLAEVPTLTVDHLSPEEVRAYVIADNQLATLAGWDRELLSLEIIELDDLDGSLDLTITGFELSELDLLRDVAGSRRPTLPDNPSPPALPECAVSRLGDIWEIGAHRLVCGDALNAEAYRVLLRNERADLVIADPPYNVPVKGHVCGTGLVQHREFVMASGEMQPQQFERFLAQICSHLARFSRSGSLHFLFMDWSSIGALLAAGEASYDELLNIIVWVKGNGGMGSLYRSQHEFAALSKKGKRAHKYNVALGANGRYRTNVWEYPGANSPGSSTDLKLHPTVKNLEMIADAIRDVSDQGDIVLDPFGGSGTTLLAAERCGRSARLLELDERYCDLIVRRATEEGLPVRLAASGQSLSQVVEHRSNQSELPA